MPNFTYTRGIPASSHNPSTDQPDMQINNDSIADLIEIDHFGFNDQNNSSGYHKKTTYVSNIYTLAAPPPSVAGQVVEYAFNTGVGGNALAYVRDGLGTGIQLTNTFTPAKTNPGVTFLPGGLILNFGNIPLLKNSSNPTNITFPNAYTSGLTVLSITAGYWSTDGGATAQQANIFNITGTGFSVNNTSSSSAHLLGWMAIGY